VIEHARLPVGDVAQDEQQHQAVVVCRHRSDRASPKTKIPTRHENEMPL